MKTRSKASDARGRPTSRVIEVPSHRAYDGRERTEAVGAGRAAPQALRQNDALCRTELAVVVDDKNLIRECVARCLLSALEGFSVAMFATTADCARADIDFARVAFILYNIHHRSPSDPEVEENLRHLFAMFAAAPVILLSDSEDPDRVLDALERGVRGYIPTSASIDIVVGAARLVSAGGTFVPASSLVAVMPTAENPLPAMPLAGQFTHRQMAVLRLVRQGKANRTIARELAVSESTVKAHVRNIMYKLQATNRTQIVFLTRELAAAGDC